MSIVNKGIPISLRRLLLDMHKHHDVDIQRKKKKLWGGVESFAK